MQIASGIHRIGNRSIINAYLMEEANEVTIVDAGIAALYRDLPKELASMGRTIEDVRALLLTHGHSDHIGFAERLRTERHPGIGSRGRRGARSRRGAEPLEGFRSDQGRAAGRVPLVLAAAWRPSDPSPR